MLQDLIDRIFRDPETGVRREVVGLRELSKLLDVCYKTLLRAVHTGRWPLLWACYQAYRSDAAAELWYSARASVRHKKVASFVSLPFI